MAYQNLVGRCLVCKHGSHVIKIPKAVILLSVYYVRCYLVYIYSMLRPFLLENDDGLSLAVQYAGRGNNNDNTCVVLGCAIKFSIKV